MKGRSRGNRCKRWLKEKLKKYKYYIIWIIVFNFIGIMFLIFNVENLGISFIVLGSSSPILYFYLSQEKVGERRRKKNRRKRGGKNRND